MILEVKCLLIFWCHESWGRKMSLLVEALTSRFR